ncbi:aconitate hydratase [Oleiagrimonas sp. C23AA]|uniref:aconitate hydratase n=1 Tax=Oleiagrimonas sp. C23AA TaxID=2719047 RepID=UPI001423CEDB|nr:aconitate hydratase [Oleiagrimonas sp. C23AA]NII11918.1 aconitate hydratase [Oleiagrimonas sp. C23AA]
MAMNVAQKLIHAHLVDGQMEPGSEIALKIDQTLTQDATGTLVMLELEAMGLERVQTEVSAQYVDHNLIQEDFKNPDDHLFLQSACQRFGVWFSRPGNGVSHAVHMQHFGKPGKTLLGSDSHTPAAGSMGMLAIGAGGIEVALAMAGEPFYTKMPKIWGVKLTGELPQWCSAKDVILEMLRRHDVDGGVGRIIEYYGPGLKTLSAMDRHVIANMGAELGATCTVFPSDEATRRFLSAHGRGDDWSELLADEGADYDVHETIDLAAIEPLIAKPSSPGNVVPVSQIAGQPLYQAYIGSSANPGYRDYAMAAQMVKDRGVSAQVSFDINPSSRGILATLIRDGHISALIEAGARLHQAGCNGCIGMGQAPASGRNSLRTTPRNFPGRSGTKEDAVFLCSPETATASALSGVITDPRTLDFPCPAVAEPDQPIVDTRNLEAPLPLGEARNIGLVKGPNIASLPDFEALPDALELPIILKVGDDISTDEIMPAGARVLPFRSNIPKIAEFVYDVVDEGYVKRAKKTGDHAIVGGENYGQGSSREHAALAPRYLGLRAVVAKDYARIHWQNLVNFGVLPLTFANADDYDKLEPDAVLVLDGLHEALRKGAHVKAKIKGKQGALELRHQLSPRQVDMLLAGGQINWMKRQQAA